MGLDIGISANNSEQLYKAQYEELGRDYRHLHSLSRTFCNFMCRQNVASHEPELDQIGQITGVDIAPIYQMEQYPEDEGMSFFLDMAETEEEKQKILADAERDKQLLKGNIDKVLNTITALIEKLSAIQDLPALLIETDFDSLDNGVYFADFNTDKGEGYIGNNFGHDLRNFKRYLEFAKSHGTDTVWFNYG